MKRPPLPAHVVAELSQFCRHCNPQGDRIMSVAVKPKKGPKEPSIEKLAKEKARGNGAANGRLPHPSITSTTTPPGIVANDRDAWKHRSNVASPPATTDEPSLREKLMAIAKLPVENMKPTGPIGSAECLRIADLLGAQVWTGEEYEEAEDLVDRFGHLVKPVAPIVSPETKPPKRETAEAWHSVVTGEAVEIGIDLLHEHPENRDSRDSDQDVKDLAESIREDTQLQPIMVRLAPPHWNLPKGHFQIVFGERRWRACRVAGLQSVRGVIRKDLDDATTRRLIVIENAKRKDLNPIQKAQLVETLCSPNKDGTPGLTREAAARHVGLESGSAASNLVRLLKLPKVWQERVAAGELPESFARLILPYCHAPKLMDQINASWEAAQQSDAEEPGDWESRANVEAELRAIFREHTRPIERGDTFDYDYAFAKQLPNYEDRGAHPLRFELTPKLEQDLEIVTFEHVSTGWQRNQQDVTVRRATNTKLYDKHQIPAIKEHGAAKRKAGAAKVGRDKPAPKREPTAAEKKQAAAERTKQLTARIAAWRDKLLRRELIAQINAGLDDGFRLVIAYAAEPAMGLAFDEVLKQASKGKSQSDGWRKYWWGAVAGAKDGDAEEALTAAMAIQILQHEPSDWRRPTVPHAMIERYAEDLGVNAAQAWGRLQETVAGKLAGGELLEELFLFHRTDELLALCRELNVGVMPTATRGAMVKALLQAPVNNTRRLPLPKCIRQLAVSPKRGTAKRSS